MKTTKKNKMENNLWKKSTKINLIGCDTIVNSPSLTLIPTVLKKTNVIKESMQQISQNLVIFVKNKCQISKIWQDMQ